MVLTPYGPYEIGKLLSYQCPDISCSVHLAHRDTLKMSCTEDKTWKRSTFEPFDFCWICRVQVRLDWLRSGWRGSTKVNKLLCTLLGLYTIKLCASFFLNTVVPFRAMNSGICARIGTNIIEVFSHSKERVCTGLSIDTHCLSLLTRKVDKRYKQCLFCWQINSPSSKNKLLSVLVFTLYRHASL